MRKRNILIAGLVISASVAAGVLARAKLGADKPAKFKSYTIVWQVTEYDAAGGIKRQYTETRYKASTGRWYDIKQLPDGQREETFAEPGDGVYALGKGKKVFLSSAARTPQVLTTEEQWRSTPVYLRSEVIHGLRTVVIKGGPDDSFEIYVAPELNNDWVKEVMRFESGASTVMEPVSIDLSEPDPSVFKRHDLPVDYSLHEEKLRMRGGRQ